MTMTFEIPPDVQAGVAGIPDLNQRVAQYLRHEANMEALRRQRHSQQAREIVRRALDKVEADHAAGFDWDASFEDLQKVHQEISLKP